MVDASAPDDAAAMSAGVKNLPDVVDLVTCPRSLLVVTCFATQCRFVFFWSIILAVKINIRLPFDRATGAKRSAALIVPSFF